MKFVTFQNGSSNPRPGLVGDDLATVVDLSAAFPDMLTLIRAGDEGLAKAKAIAHARASTYPLAETTLLAPIPNPPRIRDCSVFEEHMQGGARFAKKMGWDMLAKVPDVWYESPVYYKCNHLSVAGPDTVFTPPIYSKKTDYELEVACVIGKGGKDIAKDKAMDHLFGLMIYNDLSSRDALGREMISLFGPVKGKDFDNGNIFGPWLVTKDELPDLYTLEMRAYLNGELKGKGTTADMYHKWDAIISYASAGETLHPGEIIGSGTVPGGTLAEFGQFLSTEDRIEFQVDRLGTLRVTVG